MALYAIPDGTNSWKTGQLYELFPNITNPDTSFLLAVGCVEVTSFKGHNSAVQELIPCAAYVEDNVVYNVTVVDLPQDRINQIAASAALKAEKALNDKIEALWSAADKYCSNYISGIAIGLLTIGVIQSKPKALAVTAWSSDIWTEYYVRKALLLNGDTVSLDFSSFGPMPYTVPELRTELGM